MIDWLEIALRELSPDPGEVSEVFTVGEPKDLKKSGPPPTSGGGSPAAEGCVLDGGQPIAKGTAEREVSAVFTVGRTRNPEKSEPLEMSASPSAADAPALDESDLENPSALEAATAKTAKRWVFDVFAVGAPKDLGKFASELESDVSTWTPPAGFQKFDNPPDGALRKPSKPIIEEECLRDGEVPDRELRKPSKPLLESERLSREPDMGAHWRRRFEDESIVVQRARDLSPEQAKAEAFRHIVIEYLNETHPNTDPRVCAHCGGRDLPLTPTLPFGVGNRHAWLDQHCAQAWREGRRKAAIEKLAGMGIVEPPKDEAPVMNEVVDMIGKLSTGVSFAGEISVAPGHGPATAFAPRAARKWPAES
jgi:hypothetical protein